MKCSKEEYDHGLFWGIGTSYVSCFALLRENICHGIIKKSKIFFILSERFFDKNLLIE